MYELACHWEPVVEMVANAAPFDRGSADADALQKAQDEPASEQSLEDLAYDSVDQEMIGNLSYYFDYTKFGRDLKIEGGLTNHLYEDLEDAKSKEDEDEVERIEEAIEYYDNLSDREAGEYAIENFYGEDNIPKKILEMYVDYAKLARDLSYDYNELRLKGGRVFTLHAHN